MMFQRSCGKQKEKTKKSAKPKKDKSAFFVKLNSRLAVLLVPPKLLLISKMSSRYNLEARISTLRHQLAAAERELDEMEFTSPDRLLLATEMEAMALAFETRAHYKSNWQKAINGDLVKNVANILEECYYYLIDADSGLDLATVKAQTGELGSRQWQLFVLKVIHYLKQEGCFIRDEKSWNFDTFEDTAGGCDEVTEDAAIYLIEHPEWQPN